MRNLGKKNKLWEVEEKNDLCFEGGQKFWNVESGDKTNIGKEMWRKKMKWVFEEKKRHWNTEIYG